MYKKLLNLVFVAAAAAPYGFGASKEIVEIQREIAELQGQFRDMQRTLDQRLPTIERLSQQAFDASSKTNTALAVLESGLRDRIAQQLSTSIAGSTTKVDQMSIEFQSVRENVTAMNETLTKMQAQLLDLSNAIKVLQTPAAPPPSTSPSPGALPGASTGPPPGLSAQQLYNSAMRDRSSGNLDLAMQGLQEFLKWFGTSELAPAAQYNIGQIYYDKNDYASAVRAFDTVQERFGENNKTPDAIYMKGMALLKSGQRTQAAQEFLTVIQKYPNSEVATKARAQRKALGLSVPTAAAVKPAAARRRR